MSWIAEVKEKLNIIDLIKSEGIQLKFESSGRYTCRCPFHTEKTASFKVSEDYQNFKCFGCGEYGDAITFFAKRNVLDYMTSAKILAERLGIKITNNFDTDRSKKIKRYFKLIFDLENFYIQEFNKLSEYHPAKKQITNRQLKITEKTFGYAPSDAQTMIRHMTSLGYNIDELKDLGFVNEKDNVQLKDRLVFFIRNYMGYTIGFSGRALTANHNGFKYINSKSSIMFNKQIALYNIENAKESSRKLKYIFLVEGQFDVIAMKQHGYENVVCISGTAFTKLHKKEILRCVGEDGRIVLLLDSDEAGKNAMNKIFQENPDIHENLYIINLPIGEDPCDYLKKTKILPKAESILSNIYMKLKKSYPTDVLENRQIFIKEVQDQFTKYITNEQIKDVYLRSACILSGIDYKKLKIKSVNTTSEEHTASPQTTRAPLDDADRYFLASIGFYILNKEKFDNSLDPTSYPHKYRDFIKEYNSKKDVLFIPENFTKPKLVQIITDIEFEKLSTKKLCIEHYNTLINLGLKVLRNKVSKEKTLLLINNIEGLPTEKAIEVLTSKEGI